MLDRARLQLRVVYQIVYALLVTGDFPLERFDPRLVVLAFARDDWRGRFVAEKRDHALIDVHPQCSSPLPGFVQGPEDCVGC